MTVIFKDGDIFTTTLPAIGHGVNIQGDMGSGIARTIKELFPKVEKDYRKVCARGKLKTGELLPITDEKTGLIILNIASQEYGGPNAKYLYLAQGLQKAFEYVREQKLSGFAIPRIGAGVGGLSWDIVLTLVEEIAGLYPDVDLEVWTYAP